MPDPKGPPDKPGVKLYEATSREDIKRFAHDAQQALDKDWNIDLILVAYPKEKD